ncbi:MAG: hypothetical protein AAGL08_13900 [Cyanobacteria bacterium J06573_11]
MGRRLPSWRLQQQATQAAAREQYYANRNSSDDNFNANVESRPRIQVGYRSLNRKIGATPDHAKIAITASETAVKWFEGVADTGTLSGANTRLGLEYDDLTEHLAVTKFEASKLHATLGATTPTAVRTPWGTRYTKYTKSGEGNARASYTAPLSEKTGAFSAADLAAAAQLIADIAAIRNEIKENGRMWFEPEQEDFTLVTD